MAEQQKKTRRRVPREERIAARRLGDERRRARDERNDALRERMSAAPRKQETVVEKNPQIALRPNEFGKEVVYAANSIAVVEVKRGFSLRGLPENLLRAGTRFAQDWESALAKLGSKGFEPGVQGGGSSSHVKFIEAQTRLKELEAKLGGRDYQILIATVILGVGPSELHKNGGPENKVISAEIRRILREVASYYSGKPQKPDPLLRAAEKAIQAALEDREAEIDVTNRE